MVFNATMKIRASDDSMSIQQINQEKQTKAVKEVRDMDIASDLPQYYSIQSGFYKTCLGILSLLPRIL
jgi:hypothetical protein